VSTASFKVLCASQHLTICELGKRKTLEESLVMMLGYCTRLSAV
jgi:hypothetical protein